MQIAITCKTCNDAWLEETKDVSSDTGKPEYEYYPDANFDDIKAYKCSRCGHVIEVEVGG